MARGRVGALLVVALMGVPALGWARIFEWTDKAGQVHYTDNVWELPDAVRTRYLELIEEEARQKFSVQQIRDMKEAGNWPPIELVRPKVLKSNAPTTEWMGLKLLGDDAEIHRSMANEFRFQWDSFYKERKQLEGDRAAAEAAVKAAEENVARVRMEDLSQGRPQAYLQAPAAEKALKEAQDALQKILARQAELPGKERALSLGQRAFGHPGEDGGRATFGPGSR